MRGILVSLLLAFALVAPVPVAHAVVRAPETSVAAVLQVGKASFYHSWFDGRKTASGAIFDSQLLTAAHRTFEFGTRVRVTNLVNLKSVIVTINDRGPFVKGRVIDLSRRAATALGFVRDGVTRVKIEPITVASAL
ncbi:MAG TPA: septal ring lytic transglycosylase RlpA family protein [Candidatus Polarisedimenticolia bacterium]|nr:septal ring lytic transglycosylase RlpA family protein [Candidatus Polarisedimenticolia bacterium]